MGKICFFIGHRDAPETLLPALKEAVARCIRQGASDFYVGRYGRFDALAAQAVLAAKRQGAAVTLTLLLPYHPAERPVPTLPGFDGTFYPPGLETVPRRAAIVRANRCLVDLSSFLIAYARYPAGNAWNLLQYALARQEKGLLSVENLAEISVEIPG